MAGEGPVRLRIVDLLVLVVAAAVAVAGTKTFLDYPSQRESGEVALWLLTGGMALILYLVFRFVRTLWIRFLLLGLAMAFTSFWCGLYTAADLDLMDDSLTGGLRTAAGLLVAGAVVSALIDQWRSITRGEDGISQAPEE